MLTMSARLRLILVLWIGLCTGVLAATPDAVYQVDLPAQGLAQALNGLSEQTGAPIVFSYDLVRNRTTRQVTGRYTLQEALNALLADTGLSGGLSDKGVLTISAAKSSNGKPGETPVTSDQQTQTNKKNLRSIRPAGIAAFFASMAAAFSASAEDAGNGLSKPEEEVIVTAQKKSERLQDVPVPLTVVDTEALAQSGAGRIQDYFATVPGLSLSSTPIGPGTQYITLRGLSTTNTGGPTVAMVIDDVPFGLSTGLNLGQFGYPDIDPSDLARIEVLKGPQGTLYGADSLGGLIKVVTQDPSTTMLSGHVQVLGEDVAHGDAGYGVRGSVNVPISDTFAARASAFARRDPGYVDNVTSGQSNVNDVNVYGARLGTLWKPADGFSLKLGALFQNTQGFGSSQINANILLQPTLGDFQQTGVPGTGRYNTQVQLYTATLNAKLSDVNLVSISSYGINKWSNLTDFSLRAPRFVTPYFPGVTGADYLDDSTTHNFSQEVRLSASLGHWFDWLAGAFYTHQSNNLIQDILAANPLTGTVFGHAYDSNPQDLTFWESAAFGDVTTHITNNFDVQLGGRMSWNHQTFDAVRKGPAVPGTVIQPTLHATGNAFTYLVTPEYKFSPDLMVYARVASGYRVGGPNFAFGQPGVPESYRPDKTTNYDLGMKTDLFDHTLTLDLSAYYINWKDIQLGVRPTGAGTCSCSYQLNGARAKSEGVELSVDVHPVKGTTLWATGSFNNAVLTQNLPPAAVTAGAYALADDRLPYSVRTSGSVGFDQDVFRVTNTTGYVGADVTYIGARYGEFASSPTARRLLFPSYTTVNVHAGVRYDSWVFNLFADNLGDKLGILGGGPSTVFNNPAGYYAMVIQPRTIGLSVTKSF